MKKSTFHLDQHGAAACGCPLDEQNTITLEVARINCEQCVDIVLNLPSGTNGFLYQKDEVSRGHDVGYVRVSSADQKTDRQLEGVRLDAVYKEKISGKDTQRPQLQECLKYVRGGDTLHVHSIDRFARNLGDLDRMVKELINKGVKIKFYKENLFFDGANPFHKFQMHIIGAVAEFEREIIRERQREGIAIALKKGVHFGRKKVLNESQIAEIETRITQKERIIEIARDYGVNKQMIYRVKKEFEDKIKP